MSFAASKSSNRWPILDLNAYLALAALHVYQATHEVRYLDFAMQVGARANRRFTK